MPTWKVVAGKKRGGPFETQELRRMADAGRLPSSTFIRAEDDSTDWQQFTTVSWLVDEADSGVVRYCPDCDSRIIVASTTLDEPGRCPSCSAIGKLTDYLDASRSPIEDLPVEPWGPYDLVVILFAVVMSVAAITGAFSLFFNPWFAVLLGFIMLIMGGWLFAISFHHRSQTSRYRTHLRNLEATLGERTQRLEATERDFLGLSRNLVAVRDNLIRDTEIEIKTRRARIARELEMAQEQSGAVHRMAAKFLEQAYDWWITKLHSENFQATKDRLQKAIEFCRKQGVDIPAAKQKEVFEQLKIEYEKILRRETEREEQRRIREQIREEQRIEREMKRKVEAAETEQKAIQRALDAALKKADAEHSAEVELLRQQLREAEAKAERAKSQAQLTKVGHVYVISNIGSFGDNVFKVGLTRRLEPVDRVRELGDASVPFPFDVHMMIFSEDAPKLECTLHQALHRHRMNRVNFRKEYFRVDIETIRDVVEQHHGRVEYIIDPEAAQYRDSLQISDEDFEYLEKVSIAQGIEDEDDDVDSIEE